MMLTSSWVIGIGIIYKDRPPRRRCPLASGTLLAHPTYPLTASSLPPGKNADEEKGWLSVGIWNEGVGEEGDKISRQI